MDSPSITIDLLSEEYGCDQSTISKILKEKDKLLSMQLMDYFTTWNTNRWNSTNSSQKFAELLSIPETEFKASPDLPNQRQKLAELLLQYKSEDVYNADETDEAAIIEEVLPQPDFSDSDEE
ncbi:10464_t:CDS:2, partial [Racocetra fulgida]